MLTEGLTASQWIGIHVRFARAFPIRAGRTSSVPTDDNPLLGFRDHRPDAHHERIDCERLRYHRHAMREESRGVRNVLGIARDEKITLSSGPQFFALASASCRPFMPPGNPTSVISRSIADVSIPVFCRPDGAVNRHATATISGVLPVHRSPCSSRTVLLVIDDISIGLTEFGAVHSAGAACCAGSSASCSVSEHRGRYRHTDGAFARLRNKFGSWPPDCRAKP